MAYLVLPVLHVRVRGRHTREQTNSDHILNDNEDGDYDDDDDSDDADDENTLFRLSAGSEDAAALRLSGTVCDAPGHDIVSGAPDDGLAHGGAFKSS